MTDLRFDVKNGATLCVDCHDDVTGRETQFEESKGGFMTNSERDIRDRVTRMTRARGHRSRRPTPQPVLRTQNVVIPKEEKTGFFSAFLGTCVVLLSIAITVAMLYKSQDQEVIANDVVSASRVTEQLQPIKPQVDPAAIARLQTLEKRMDSWQRRTWLLALTTNETSALLRKMDKTQHKVNDRGFITMGEDWRLSKVPETMAFTEEQKETIRNGSK